ncbi:MAG: HEAT repeat domain-containing protein [Acidimicrobiales bacterium]
MSGDGSTLPEDLSNALVRAGYADDDESATLIDSHVTSSVTRARVLALRAAQRRQRLDDQAWVSAFNDVDARVRREALTLASHSVIGPPVVEAIAALLADADPLVVDAAAFALGEHHATHSVVALCEVAGHHDDPRCREAAVAALGALGDERGRATVLAALDDRATVRRRAIVALAAFDGPDVDAALERSREDRDWQVRAAVDQLVDPED